MSEQLKKNIEVLKNISGCDVELVGVPPIIKSQVDVDCVMMKFTKKAKTVNLVIPSQSANAYHQDDSSTEHFLFGVRQIISILESEIGRAHV